MATIVITDETAAAQAIIMDALRNLGINGAAVDRFTINGSVVAGVGAVAASSTVDSTSLSPTFGSATLAANAGSTTVTTTAGRLPCAVVLHSGQNTNRQKWDGITCSNQSDGIPRFEVTSLVSGSFQVVNNDKVLSPCTLAGGTASYAYL